MQAKIFGMYPLMAGTKLTMLGWGESCFHNKS